MADETQTTPEIRTSPGEKLHFIVPTNPSDNLNDWEYYSRPKGRKSWTKEAEGRCFQGDVLESPFHFSPPAPKEEGEWEISLVLTRDGHPIHQMFIGLTVRGDAPPGEPGREMETWPPEDYWHQKFPRPVRKDK